MRVLQQSFSNVLGNILFLAAASRIYDELSVGFLYNRVIYSIRNNMFMFVFSGDNTPVAFLAWTFFDNNRLRELQAMNPDNDLRYILTQKDLNTSGDVFFLTDFLCPFGNVRKVSKLFRERMRKLHPNFPKEYYGVNSKDGRLKRITWC